MVTKPYHADPELAALLHAAEEEGEDVRIIAGSHTFVLRLTRRNTRADDDDPFANYDPERFLRAWDASFGVLQGVDVEELLADLRAERAQHGRDDVE